MSNNYISNEVCALTLKKESNGSIGVYVTSPKEMVSKKIGVMKYNVCDLVIHDEFDHVRKKYYFKVISDEE